MGSHQSEERRIRPRRRGKAVFFVLYAVLIGTLNQLGNLQNTVMSFLPARAIADIDPDLSSLLASGLSDSAIVSIDEDATRTDTVDCLLQNHSSWQDEGGRSNEAAESLDAIEYRPVLLLHVGPHKTATSAIQCHFTHHSEMLRNKGSYVYIGRIYNDCQPKRHRKGKKDAPLFDPRDIVNCIGRHNISTPCNASQIWNDVDSILREHSQRGENLVISDEAFSRLRGDKETSLNLLHTLLSKYYRVQIVVGYRRYHEWVVSSYNHYLTNRLWNGKWPTHYSIRHALERGFSSDYSYFKTTHPTDYLRSFYGSVFDDVSVFDIHNPDDGGEHPLVEKFFRQTFLSRENVDKKNNTKTFVLNEILASMKRYSPENSNTGKPQDAINLMTLVALAKHWKLLKKPPKNHIDRLEVSKGIFSAIRKKRDSQGKLSSELKVPLDCLSLTEEEAFLNRSLSFERNVFPEKSFDMLSERESKHRAKFAKRRHCSVDVKKVLNNTEWLEFFKTL